MSEATGAIIVGYDRLDTWRGIQRRPVFTLYAIDYGAPVLADETATTHDDWAPPHSMILRTDPVEVAYDIAYMVLERLHSTDPSVKAAWPPPALADWPYDPRDDDFRGFDTRTRLHRAVAAEVKSAPPIRLQVVQFLRRSPLQEAIAAEIAESPGIRPGLVTFGETIDRSSPDALRELGFVVETYTRDLDPDELDAAGSEGAAVL